MIVQITINTKNNRLATKKIARRLKIENHTLNDLSKFSCLKMDKC